jgi:eukaryotic-like serine/threonine-protein kinase
MDCLNRSRVEQFFRGELPAEQVPRLERHFDDCLGCRALAVGIARVAALSSCASVASPGSISASSWAEFITALARSSGAGQLPLLAAGERIGAYRLLEVLGQGGMGVVYRAAHEASGEVVALKTVVAPNALTLAAMRQECAFLARQRHPGIVRVIDQGVERGSPWYAMEFLEGLTLQSACAELRRDAPGQTSPAPLGPEQLEAILALFIRLCEPLSFLHRAGIVHCDLKPANVLVRPSGQPVLIDFGLLSRAGGSIGRESLEVGGKLRGTMPYMAPELIRGKIPDARADLYSLGCNLFESLTGTLPFAGTSVASFVKSHLESEPVAASSVRDGIPRELDLLLAGLLAKQPNQRLGDAEVVADVLSSIASKPRTRTRGTHWTPYLFRPQMVGRERALAAISGLLEAAKHGSGGLVLIEGESGIGKTFLASEVARKASGAGFRVVTGECSALGADASSRRTEGQGLQPFRELIQAAIDDPVDPMDLAAPVVPRASPYTLRLLARYVPSQPLPSGAAAAGAGNPAALAATPATEPPHLPPEAERERVLHAMRELLEALTHAGPLLVILDDLQWADDLSLSVLSDLATRFLESSRILILALFRSEEAPRALRALPPRAQLQRIVLPALDSRATHALISDLLSGASAEELADAVTRLSDGNPFFVAECLRAAALDGRLTYSAAGWRWAAPAHQAEEGAPALPGSLHSLLRRRLDVLAAPARRALDAASILGRTFEPRLLADMLGTSLDQAECCVDDLVQRQLVLRTLDGQVRFVHDKLREAAYAGIEPEARARLHHAAANALERAYADSPELPARYAALAHHFAQCQESARAVDYLEKAGEHALRVSSGAEAARWFREALELDGARDAAKPGNPAKPADIARHAYWKRRRGDALQSIGDLSGSRDTLLEAVALLGYAVPPGGAKLGLGIVRQLLTQVLHRTLPPRWYAERGPSGLLEVARAYDRLIQIFYYRGEYVPLLFANLATINIAERAPIAPNLAAAYTNAAATAGLLPLRGLASTYFELAERTLERAYDPEVESYYRLVYAHYQTGLGNWGEALTAADRGLELAAQLGFSRRWEDGAAVRCSLAMGRDFDEALHWCERMQSSAERRGDHQIISWGLLRRAEIHAARGNVDALAEHLQQAESLVQGLGHPERIRWFGMQALLLASRRELVRALACAAQAEALIKETKAIHSYCVEPIARLCEVHLAAHKLGYDTLANARSACATLNSAARIFPIAQPRACLHQGQLHWLEGRPERAQAAWAAGHAQALRLGLDYDRALLELQSNALEQPAGAAPARAALDRLGVTVHDLIAAG